MSFHDDGGKASEMTLRDYFAAKALQGMLADSEVAPKNESLESFAKELSEVCYIYADEMIEARKK